MNAASTLALPGSRTLAGWWRQLAPFSPECLWVAHLLLHHVEAQVRIDHSYPAEPLTRLLLDALALDESGAAPPPRPCEALRRLDSALHLGSGLAGQVVRGLVREGLAEPWGGGWRLTAEGRRARETGEYVRAASERRAFHFVRTAGGDGPPHFLALRHTPVTPAPAQQAPPFDPEALRAAVALPADWKRRYGFPTEVAALAGGEGIPHWQTVIVDKPERLLVAIVRAAGEGGPRLLGFAVRQDGWALHAAEPAFVIAEDWHEAFPELTGDVAAPEAAAAWQGWARSRGISDEESAGSGLAASGARLRVAVPAAAMARLRAGRSDALKGEAWLLVGEGPVRQALLLELVEAAPVG